MLPPDYARWRPKFAKALDPQRYTIEHVDQMVTAGVYLLDACDKAAILTEAKLFPTGAWEIHGVLHAGDPQIAIEKLLPIALERGRRTGALGFSMASRSAWVKLLRPHGFHVVQTEIRLDF